MSSVMGWRDLQTGELYGIGCAPKHKLLSAMSSIGEGDRCTGCRLLLVEHEEACSDA